MTAEKRALRAIRDSVEAIRDGIANEIRAAERAAAESMRERAARKAAIHCNYPIEDDWDRGYARGRAQACDEIRALPLDPDTPEP